MSRVPHKTVMIIAGEVSGDIHGGRLVQEIHNILPDTHFVGVGGENMQREGVTLLHHVSELAVLGLIEVLYHYPRIRKVFYDLIEYAAEHRPDAVILIDYPGFNIRIAEHFKRLNIPVIYFISPQIWAWGQHRKKVIAERVDKMLVFFEFEKEFYADTGLDVEFVGHPLVERVEPDLSRDKFFENTSLQKNRPILGLLPGSRQNEIVRLLPVMLESAFLVHQRIPELQIVLPIGSAVPRDVLTGIFDRWRAHRDVDITVVERHVHEVMAYSDTVLVASGTATLETACLGTPMIILYKVNVITALFARLVIKIPYIGLVNVVAKNKVAPEFLQYDARPSKIAECAYRYVTDKALLSEKKRELAMVRERLGLPGAMTRAAGAVCNFFNKRSNL